MRISDWQDQYFVDKVRAVALTIAVSATLLLTHRPSLAQQTKPTEKSEKTKAEQPLELPEFVITGTETLDVPGGAKQSPKPSPKLTQQQLNRFNPLDKQPFSMLPNAAMNRFLLPQQEREGFLQGEFGMFITPSIDAGYRFVAGNFDLTAGAGATFSGGHRRNAEFTDLRADIQSQYLAPEKFFFFAGSRTNTYLRANYRQYRFFGADSIAFPELAPERRSLLLEGGVQTVGTFENLQYNMGVSAESVLLQGIHENTLADAHLMMTTSLGGGWNLGGNMAVQFLAASWFSMLFSPSLVADYRSSAFSLSLTAGLQTLSYTPNLYPQASIRAHLAASSLLSLTVSGYTGVRQNNFLRTFRNNPYTASTFFSSNVPPFPPENVIEASAIIHLHPSQHFAVNIGANAQSAVGKMLFDAASNNGEFVPLFRPVRSLSVWAETEVEISLNDKFALRGQANFASVLLNISGSGDVTSPQSYLPPIEGSLRYRRRWFEQFSTVVEGIYFGERTVSLFTPSATNLPAYVDVRLSAEYEFSSTISAYVRGTNLLNQTIVIWQGYQERGIFIAAGFVITF